MALALSLAAIAGMPAAAAQRFPTHAVTLVVPFPPGGGTDTGARLLAQELGKRWGQSVIVENKGGAAGLIGANFVAQAKPDGYTLLLGNIGTQSINPSLYTKMPYDPDKAFAPVSLLAELPLAVMINPAKPPQVKTIGDFIRYAKAHQGQLSYGSSGAGGGPHLATEMFKDQAGLKIQHIPYRGGGPAISALLAGDVQLTMMTVLEASGHIKAGDMRALAVTGSRRVAALPDVPTLSESVLPGFNSISWIGLLAPAGTPSAIVNKISADMRAIVADKDFAAHIATLGGVPHADTPQEFAKMIADDRSRYARIIRSHHIKVE
ncbi:MAG: Bug family tripartite tricarboxylate transporter substrate binding protein [Bordetella sp.]|uniref:Bug family tripartite tricarboxylate transporter substrate binding protein n=1 Tax=Bordetella sp. TaxID=28081 RepID=UPI003F7C2882